MNDTNERSVASAGSVVGDLRNGAPSGCETVRSEPEPLAWAVIGSGETEGHVAGLHDTRLEAEMRIARMNEVGDCARARTMLVVPLYRHPPCQDFLQKNLTLTDAEREAVKEAIDCCEDITYGGEAAPEAAATLRGLLERLGGAE